jgi:mycothiol system anti-sigma-R factor
MTGSLHNVDDDHIEPGVGDCADSLKELYTFLDGELTIERRTNIRQHLDGCQNCYEAFDFEAELRIVVSTKCRDEVPDELRSRVADALRKLSEGEEPAI